MDSRRLYPKVRVSELWDEEDRQIPVGLAPDFIHINNMEMDPHSREVHILGEIATETGDGVVERIRYLENKDPNKAIRILLNTPGGDEIAMFSIHDSIRSSPCPMEILAYGEICSAGVLLLVCGDRRLVTESIALMSHESQLSNEGLGFRASRDRQKFHEWQHLWWCELMSRYTPNTPKYWKLKTERQAEFWLLGGDAVVKAGLADRVVKRWPVGVSDLTTKREVNYFEHSKDETE